MRRQIYTALLRNRDRRMQRRYEPYLAHFRAVVGYQPSILLPRRYHEKMLWRKLFDHNPLFVTFCDKLATKEFIASRLPSLRQPATLWSGANLNEIPRDLLDRRCMIKCNHGCAFNHLWLPGRSNFTGVKLLTDRWLATVYGVSNKEWGYTKVVPRVYAEEYIEAPHGDGLLDIKIRCCDGEPVLVRAYFIEGGKKVLGWFDAQGKRLALEGNEPDEVAMPPDFQLPPVLGEILEASRVLGQGLDYGRLDFLTDGRTVFGGEITVYPGAGLCRASPENSHGPDTYFNPHWDLRKSWFLSTTQHGLAGLYVAALRAAL